MKQYLLLFLTLSSLSLSACSDGPKMLWAVDDNKPDYARGSDAGPDAKGRAPLDIPPELRNEMSVPMPDQVAVDAARGDVKMSVEEKKAVAGKAVSLDTRLYANTAADVFSNVIDAMTALNMPVESVDSPSGTITTAWVRKNASKQGGYMSAAMNVFGGGPQATRYRFIVRVFRMADGQTQMQIRTLGQQFINRHWVFKQLKRKVANELFSAVEERLAPLADKPAVPAQGASLPVSQ